MSQPESDDSLRETIVDLVRYESALRDLTNEVARFLRPLAPQYKSFSPRSKRYLRKLHREDLQRALERAIAARDAPDATQRYCAKHGIELSAPPAPQPGEPS